MFRGHAQVTEMLLHDRNTNCGEKGRNMLAHGRGKMSKAEEPWVAEETAPARQMLP